MKRNLVSLARQFYLLAFLVFATTAAHAQLAEDLRPFDFSDKFYEMNGVYWDKIVGRKNGNDGKSLFDTPPDTRFNEIRILETFPAYDREGETIFWNHYGGLTKESFTADYAGDYAIGQAYAHPMYAFPSTMVRGSDRQASLIDMGAEYFQKNTLGVAAVFIVNYTDKIYTKRGRAILEILVGDNGMSLDGTPIIKTAKQLDDLASEELVTIEPAWTADSGRTQFAIAKVWQIPERSITPDAFLVYVREKDGNPLDAESKIVSLFDCLKTGICG